MLAFLFLPYCAGYVLLHLSIEEHYMNLLELPALGVSEYIRPEYVRYAARSKELEQRRTLNDVVRSSTPGPVTWRWASSCPPSSTPPCRLTGGSAQVAAGGKERQGVAEGREWVSS